MTERHFTTWDGMKLFDRVRPGRAVYIILLQPLRAGQKRTDLPACRSRERRHAGFRWLE